MFIWYQTFPASIENIFLQLFTGSQRISYISSFNIFLQSRDCIIQTLKDLHILFVDVFCEFWNISRILCFNKKHQSFSQPFNNQIYDPLIFSFFRIYFLIKCQSLNSLEKSFSCAQNVNSGTGRQWSNKKTARPESET